MERLSSRLYVDGWDGWLSQVVGSLGAPSVLIKLFLLLDLVRVVILMKMMKTLKMRIMRTTAAAWRSVARSISTRPQDGFGGRPEREPLLPPGNVFIIVITVMMIMIRMKLMMMRGDILKFTRRKDNVRVWGLLSPLHLSFKKINVIVMLLLLSSSSLGRSRHGLEWIVGP